MNTQAIRVLVLGGGYSGLMAALRLAGRTRRLHVSITVVNALDHFVERPRLHEQATGSHLRGKALAQMLRGTRVRVKRGWVSAVDPDTQSVTLRTPAGDEQMSYDYLLHAVGSRVDHGVPGVAEHAFTLDPYGERTTEALQKKLETCGHRPFRVVVVGGGATGVEAAGQIVGTYPRGEVHIVSQGHVGGFKGARVQRHIVEALTEQSIVLHEHCHVTRVEPRGVVLASRCLPADIVVWAGGFRVSTLARDAGLAVNNRNQTLVDPTLRSVSCPNIFAVGDAAHPVETPGAPIRMSLFTALVTGAQAGENIAALLTGHAPKPLSFVWYGQGIALGPRDAVGFATYPADEAWPLILRRQLAVRVRSFFVWYLGAALELERRFPGSFVWTGKRRYARQPHRFVDRAQAASVRKRDGS